ncbi:putative addiction module CopG family antidote [Rhizobium aethiopicum]|uniref:Putative addiction module CopG family antidote n=1 Tax=Rhizobium aethiopicum TaxID=1138170 RepID=A0A7W6QE09_9HYPH|nr:type II toxin-antitoxin system ParD family antitoxin [Rhizobium aethiopicum]MBB4195805.1 putative addiction module CopG family antidote [Rhizobium aethiopicum]MBB4583470.1 putative addiction module CopG family antidote [Rhizobium aethiopicum]
MGEAAKITVTLEPRLEEYVRDEVARGAFKSSSDYIESVLRERYNDDRRVPELEEELQKGIEDGSRPERIP